MVFTTPRLDLRPWTVEDAEAILGIFGDREVSRWTSMPEPLATRVEALERIERWTTPIDGHPDLGHWAVVLRSTGEPVGTMLLRPLADTDDIEIGWSLHRAHWGNGYATEAAAAALDRAWALGCPGVRAIMWPDNGPSAKVCERIGMISLGVVEDPWYGSPECPTSLMFRIERPQG